MNFFCLKSYDFLYFFLVRQKRHFETVSRDKVTRRDEIETVSSRLAFFRDETVSVPALNFYLRGLLVHPPRRGPGGLFHGQTKYAVKKKRFNK